MKFDKKVLELASEKAIHEYKNPDKSGVRSGKFIGEYHSYCEQELIKQGLPPAPIKGGLFGRYDVVTFTLKKETEIVGAYVRKAVDVALTTDTSGPFMAISIKSQMSSIKGNMKNRFEEYVGDATNLHGRFPLMVYGFLMILPYKGDKKDDVIIDASGKPTETATQILRMLEGSTGRGESTSLPGTYEEAALAVIDFDVSPKPTLHTTFPPHGGEIDLRIDTFVDRLLKKMYERNPFLVP